MIAAIRIVAVFGGLASLAFFALNADYTGLFPEGFDDIFASDITALAARTAITILAVLSPLWIVSPFIVSYKRAPRLSGAPMASTLSLAAVAIAAVSSLYYYWKIMVIAANPDPQDGLVFLVLPMWQLLGVSGADVVAGIVKRFE